MASPLPLRRFCAFVTASQMVLSALPRVLAGQCDKNQEHIINNVFSGAVVDALNSALSTSIPRTLGECAGAPAREPSLQPCQPIAGLPVHQQWPGGLTLDVNHLTHVDTLRVSSLALRCLPKDAKPARPPVLTASAAASSLVESARAQAVSSLAWLSLPGWSRPAPPSTTSTTTPAQQDLRPDASRELRWFMTLQGGFEEFAIGLKPQIAWPRVTFEASCAQGKRCLIDLHNLTIKATARLTCVDEHTFGMKLSDDHGLEFGDHLKLDLGYYGMKVDLTDRIAQTVQEALAAVKVPCDELTGELCRMLCGTSAAVGLGKKLLEAARAAGGSQMLGDLAARAALASEAPAARQAATTIAGAAARVPAGSGPQLQKRAKKVAKGLANIFA